MSAQRAFFIVQLEIDDREGYDRYANADHVSILNRFGGRVVVAEDDVKSLEGDWAGTRTVVVEFPSREQAEGWYHSAEYQALAAIRQAATRSNVAIVSGGV